MEDNNKTEDPGKSKPDTNHRHCELCGWAECDCPPVQIYDQIIVVDGKKAIVR